VSIAYPRLSSLLLAFVLSAVPSSIPRVLADPPPGAPARASHEHHGDTQGDDADDDHDHEYRGGYRSDDDRLWVKDYGVVHGRCDRAVVGAVIGAAVGGAVGTSVGHEQNGAVAVLAGAGIESLVGYQIGHNLDRSDRGCIGQALELTNDGQEVRWRDDQRGIEYVVVPLRPWSHGESTCREFQLRTLDSGRSESRVSHACRSADGQWHIA